MKNIAIVLAGGRGARMNSDIPKQYMDVAGKPLLYYSLAAFQESFIDEIIIVCRKDDIDYVKNDIVGRYAFDKVTGIVQGGEQRYDSVYNGLRLIAGCCENDNTYEAGELSVYIHDGARPCIDTEMLQRLRADVLSYGACVAAMPVKDTIKIADSSHFAASTPDRSTLWMIQTPQVFTFSLIWEAYCSMREDESGHGSITDDAMLVECYTDKKVYLSEGSYRNIKVTTPEDIGIAELFLKKYEKSC